jgi:DNA-binding transcriptional regulator YiaG
MSNVMKILKDEITRLSKKQARAVGTPIRKDIAGFRKAIAALRRDVAALQRNVKAYSIEFKKKAAVEPAPVEEGKRVWVFGKGIRALRKKLGLSQEYFGKLIDVSSQSVALWERNPGRLDLRPSTLAKIMAARSIGAREAKLRLANMGLSPKKRGRRPSFEPVVAPVAKKAAAKPAKAPSKKPAKKAPRKK